MHLPAAFRFLFSILMTADIAHAAELDFYVGTYTKPGGSKGIYHFKMDRETGQVSGGELAAEVKSPSFLAVHPGGKFLYAASESGRQGSVCAFAIEADGKLRPLCEESARGGGACHVSVDPAAKFVFVANYGGGSIAALPIQADGRVGAATSFLQHTGSSVNASRQKEPHAHSIYADATGQFVYACDLGTDKVHGYRFDAANGTLMPDETATATLPPGSGPRHLAFHPKAEFVYTINELANTVTAFQRDAKTGALTTLETISTLPADGSDKNSTAEIFIHPNGKFLYGSNRGHDSIASFEIGADGRLSVIGHTPTGGKEPRNFALDPAGKFLLAANQNSDSIVIFKVDDATGQLAPTGQSVSVGSPVSIQFVPVK